MKNGSKNKSVAFIFLFSVYFKMHSQINKEPACFSIINVKLWNVFDLFFSMGFGIFGMTKTSISGP